MGGVKKKIGKVVAVIPFLAGSFALGIPPISGKQWRITSRVFPTRLNPFIIAKCWAYAVVRSYESFSLKAVPETLYFRRNRFNCLFNLMSNILAYLHWGSGSSRIY